MTRADWFLLMILGGVQFTHIVDFMIIMPLGPQYMDKLHLSPSQFGLVVSMYGFCASLSGFLASRYADRFDRKRWLLIMFSGFTLATLLCAVAKYYPLLLMARGLAGFFGGIVASSVLTIVGDAFHDSRRGTAMGVVMSAFSVATIIGLPLGLELARLLGWWAPFVAIGALAVVVLIMIALFVPPIRGHLAKVHESPLTLWQTLTHGHFVPAYILMAAMVMGGFILAPFMAAYLVQNMNRPESDLKYIYLVGGLATIVSMNIIGRLADRFGKRLFFRIFALLTIIPMLIMPNLPPVSLGVALIVTTFFMITSSGRMVPGQALITACAAPYHRGRFLSICATVQHMTLGIAATLSGLIVSRGDDNSIQHYEIAGLIAAGCTALTVVLIGRLRPAEIVPVAEAAPKPAAEAIVV